MAKRVKVDNVESDFAEATSGKPVENESNVSSLKDAIADHAKDTAVDVELEKKSSQSMLSAFVAHPPGIFFVDKEPEEELILLLRAHIITNVPWALAAAVLFVLPIIFLPLLSGLGMLTTLGGGMIVSATLFWFAGLFTYVFINFLYWYFNVYIVTDERVIDVDWYSIIFRKGSSAPMAKIQDVSATQGGVIAGIFDFGNVEIQTAGEERNFEFTAVPHPQLVAKKIQELMQEEDIEHEPGNAGP